MTESLYLIFVVLFIAWWFICLKLLSKSSGWESLAHKYAFKGKFSGKKLRCQSYRRGIHVGANEYGLYLAVLFVFRPFHKPLLIPWQDTYLQKTKKGFVEGYKITFPSVLEAELFFRNKTLRKLAEDSSENLKEILCRAS